MSGRVKELNDPVRLSTAISKDQHEFLQEISRRLSYRERRPVPLSELLRRAVNQCYPVPDNKQLDLF